MFVSNWTGSSAASRLGRGSAVLFLSASLTGCFFQTAAWSPAESPKNNSVEFISFKHQVSFGDSGARLDMAERRRLESFLGRVRIGYGDDVMVGVRGRKNSARDSALSGRRMTAVMAHMGNLGVPVKEMPPGPETAPWDGTVRVHIGRHVVLGPSCSDWSKPGSGDWVNRPSSNLGCATSKNLGLMLADPGDLIRARPLTPADGAAGALRVDEYRQGKLKFEKAEKTGTK